MKDVRILITGGGGPGYPLLYKAIRSSVKYNFFVCTTEIDKFKGNLYNKNWIDKAYLISPVSSPNYLKQICAIIREEKINLLFSGIDEELPILEENRELIENLGCTFVLPSVEALNISFSKWETYLFCKSLVSQPKTIEGRLFIELDNAYDLMQKPFKLKASKTRGNRHNYSIYTKNDFYYYKEKLLKKGVDFLAQEFIEGKEFNVSIAMTKEGNAIYSICREKLDKQPNTMAGAIRRNKYLERKSVEIAKKIGLFPGFSNFEYLFDKNGGYFLIDVNGGRHAAQDFNLVASGLNLADILCSLAFDEVVDSIDTSGIVDDFVTLKYVDEIVVSESDLLNMTIDLVDKSNLD
jgi:carbamoyl-phosphate synthase large subunit